MEDLCSHASVASAAKRQAFIVFLGREVQNSAVRAGLTARRSSGAGRPGTIRGETRRSVHKVSLVHGPRHHVEPSTPPAKTLVRVPCGRVRPSHASRTIGVESPYGRQAPVNKFERSGRRSTRGAGYKSTVETVSHPQPDVRARTQPAALLPRRTRRARCWVVRKARPTPGFEAWVAMCAHDGPSSPEERG